MSDEEKTGDLEDREEERESAPLRYNRRFDAFALGACGLALTLLGFLGTSYQHSQDALSANLQAVAAQWDKNFTELAQELRAVEKCAWLRGCK